MRDHATIGLHGNGQRCPACALRRESVDAMVGGAVDVPCNSCAGTGWIQFGDAEIAARMAAEARLHHWPAFDARCRIMNGSQT